MNMSDAAIQILPPLRRARRSPPDNTPATDWDELTRLCDSAMLEVTHLTDAIAFAVAAERAAALACFFGRRG